MWAWVLKFITNPKTALIIILSLASMTMYGLWQNSKINLLEEQKKAEVEKVQRAEKEKAELNNQIQDLKERHARLALQNRQIDKDLSKTKLSLKKWEAMYDEAIKNPSVDEHLINTYSERVFLDLSCATGNVDSCQTGNGSP